MFPKGGFWCQAVTFLCGCPYLVHVTVLLLRQLQIKSKTSEHAHRALLPTLTHTLLYTCGNSEQIKPMNTHTEHFSPSWHILYRTQEKLQIKSKINEHTQSTSPQPDILYCPPEKLQTKSKINDCTHKALLPTQTHFMALMVGKTSSRRPITRGRRCSNSWTASRTNTSTSAAANSLVSPRNSISYTHTHTCKEC